MSIRITCLGLTGIKPILCRKGEQAITALGKYMSSISSSDETLRFLQELTAISEINHTEAVRYMLQYLQDRKMYYFDSILPLLFKLNGDALTLNNHFPMLPLFSRVLPPQVTYKTGRQVAKSVSNAVQSVLMGATTPYYNILHVTPLYEMIRKFSSNYVGPLIETSPVKPFFVTTQSSRSVLQRSLRSGSNLIFTFAFNDCTRVRGNTARAIKYDEYQSLDPEFEPIINQVVSAVNAGLDTRNLEAVESADLPLIMRFGTPLTMENGLEQAWETSSQAEWVIQCNKCKKLNIPSLKEDLDKMLGARERKVPATIETPGLVCAKCGHYLYTREGRWMHNFPERRETHAGYHVPQAVMPFHCEIPSAWTELQQYRFNQNRMSVAEFYNEICGESYDHGQKLVSLSDLRKVATLPDRKETNIHLQKIQKHVYKQWGCGIDWGGGGSSGISKTAVAFAGLRSDGVVEIFSGWRSHTPNDFNLEANRVKDLGYTFRCQFYAMDFNGSANRIRYDKFLETGVPQGIVCPVEYSRVGNGAVARWIPKDNKEKVPAKLQVNKARSFFMLSQLIQNGQVQFFNFDYIDRDNPGLLHDFTALVEERIPIKRAGDVHVITIDKKVGPDDFAQAVNYAVCAIFQREGRWPDTSAISSIADLTEEQQRAIDPKYKDDNIDYLYED
jgi:hypothetical protein